MLLGVLVFMGWLVKLQIDIEQHSKDVGAYFSSMSILHDIKLRQEAIANKHFEESRLPGLRHYDNIADEEKFLAQASAAQTAEVEKDKHVLEEHPGEQLKVLDRWDVRTFVIIYVSAACFLFYFGFKGWKVNVHDLENSARKIDLMIRERTLEKLEQDVAEGAWKARLYDIDARERTLDIQIREKTLQKLEQEVASTIK
ncbi:hypothetical protein [Dyella japonica]|uniref:Uncharacterized protein n=1 Tax=Dyella japonica TaxID=231455 RepID=A0ABV2JYJ3_9GAMM